MVIPIDTNTVAVENATDLNTVVSVNSVVTYVYLAENITLTGGITIHPSRATLIIDGEYPIGSGNIHTFTDRDSIFADQTLGIRASSSISITIRNMNIYGGNYYGVPYIVEGSILVNTSNVSVIYENVSYTGPQMTYNRDGFTRYTDCDIVITRTGGTEAQEVGEVNRVELGGTIRISHEITATHAVFWFCDESTTSSLTVLENADVDIVSNTNYFMYNYDGLPGFEQRVPVNYTVRSGASFNLTTYMGISFNANHSIDSFLVEPDASFRYIQTAANGTLATLYLNGALSVEQGARFYMQAQNGTAPLLRFTNGTGRSLNVNNPFSFVLYSPNAAALISLGTTQFTFHGGQLNAWDTAIIPVASAGGMDDVAPHRWFKKDFINILEVAGSFTQTATTATSNLVAEDEPYPPISDLHLQTARVLSIGDWPIMVNLVEDDGSPITGVTEPFANVRIEYTINGVTHVLNGTADENGQFSIETSGETPNNIPAGTPVSIWVNIPFLTKGTRTISIAAGELWIESAIPEIPYRTRAISTNPVLLPRGVTGALVVVRDTRQDETQWRLLATVMAPMQSASGHILPDAPVYVETEGSAPVSLSNGAVAVYTGGPGVDTTEVDWPEKEGILLRITVPIHPGERYETPVYWTLQAILD